MTVVDPMARPLRVAAFTGSATISSRRFRVEQYIRPLAALGVAVSEHVARFGSWPPPERWKRPGWLLATLADRVIPTCQSHRYDLTFLQREFASTLYTLERFTSRPRLLDVDDAVWLNGSRAERNFAALARNCDGVVCGNDYIAQTVSAWNRNLLVLPTAVDTDRFHIARQPSERHAIIGWSGLHAGSKYLVGIEGALKRVLEARPRAVLRIVSDAWPDFKLLPRERIEFIRWTPDNEVPTIQQMDIGLMPIDCTEWSRGKCSYKMLLYMSCGIPVVVTPFGMNTEVLSHAEVGRGANDEDEWVNHLVALLDDEAGRRRLGDNARSVVEKHYSLNSLASRLAGYMQTFVRRNLREG